MCLFGSLGTMSENMQRMFQQRKEHKNPLRHSPIPNLMDKVCILKNQDMRNLPRDKLSMWQRMWLQLQRTRFLVNRANMPQQTKHQDYLNKCLKEKTTE